MVRKSIKINVVLNILKSLLSVVFPLITYPYATRVLGVENIGKVNYGASIITYFSLIAAFGITSYAIREGAKVQDNKKEINELSSELFSLNIVTTLFSYSLLFVLLVFVHELEDYRLLIMLQSLTILFTTFGVDWINTIFEDYLYITLRGVFTNILTVIALFVFVKTKDDLYVYALLTVVTNAVICVWNYFYCKKYIRLHFVIGKQYKKHLKNMAVFFINAVAVSIYVSADTTMLGWMVGDRSVGIYSVAVKIYSIMKLVLAAIYSVALPRLSYYASQKNFNYYKSLITKVTSSILIILLPSVMGIFVLSEEIVLVIGGDGFVDASNTLSILSIALIFAILGGIVTQCINISLGYEKINVRATILSAVENIVLNVLFIKLWHENGAAITTAISEFTVLIYCIIKNPRSLEMLYKRKLIRNFIHSILGMVIVFVIAILVHQVVSSVWITLVGTSMLSVLLYGLLLLILKNELACDVINKFLTILKFR